MAYALVPRVRAKVGWVAAGLSVIAPLAAWFATLSGEELGERLYQGQAQPQVIDHQGYGDLTWYVSLGLGLVTLLLVYLTGTTRGRALSLPSWVPWILVGVVVVAAGFTGYFVFQTGDSGSRAHWGG